MPRDTLFQNLAKETLFMDFEGTYTAITGAIENDTVNFKTGTKAIKLIVNSAGNNASFDVPLSVSIGKRSNLSRVSLYRHTATDTIISVVIRFASIADSSKKMEVTIPVNLLQAGWTDIEIPIEAWVNTGSESWDNTMVKCKIILNGYFPSGSGMVSIDNFRFCESVPLVGITFDDIAASYFQYAVPYMYSKGIRATNYVISSKVGTDDAVYGTLAQLQDSYAKGFDLGNHTHDHLGLTTLSVAQQKYQLETCANWLVANSFPRAAYDVAYPGGMWNASTITAMGSSNANMRSGRTTDLGYNFGPGKRFGYGKPFAIYVQNPDANATLAAAKGWVDYAITNKCFVMLYFHKLHPTTKADLYTWLTADFYALIDYIAMQKENKRIWDVTISEWNNMMFNPRPAIRVAA